jgi:four helix bundle protein
VGNTVERVEDLQVWQRAIELSRAITAIIDRPGFLADRRMREHLLDAADSVVSNIAEGFPQPTDRAFANYLYTSKSSTGEIRARLKLSLERHYLSEEEFKRPYALAEEVARLATGLIKYLLRSNRRGRGLNLRPPRGRTTPKSGAL